MPTPAQTQQAAPFNITLVGDEDIKKEGILEVTSGMVKEPSTGTFHPDGLFSEEIFGETTSPERLTRFGYIDLHTRVFHPKLFRNILRLKTFYNDIMAGRAYAIFDEKSKNFIRAADSDDGANTGYAFFVNHFDELIFEKSDSPARQDRVAAIAKHKEAALLSKWLVLPAGVRDYREDSGGGTSEEINKLYNSLLAYASAIDPKNGEDPVFDTIRYGIQKKVCAIYEYIENILSGPKGGKRGFLQKKFGSRYLALGSRNVISAATFTGNTSESPTFHDVDSTKVPIVVAASSFQPSVIYWLRHMFINQIITRDVEQASVIDPKTGKLGFETIDEKEKDLYTTSEGVAKLINLFENVKFRDQPVSIRNRDGKVFYFFYIYDDGETIYITKGKETFIENYKAKFGTEPDISKLRPMTYVEMFYMATFRAVDGKFVSICRYPAIEMGSTYVSRVHLISTTPSRRVKLGTLVDLPKDMVFSEYPIPGNQYVDSTIIHPAWMSGLTADYDGDMVSNNSILNEASVKECEAYLNSKASILDPNGRLSATINTDLIKLVMHNLSWSPDLER